MSQIEVDVIPEVRRIILSAAASARQNRILEAKSAENTGTGNVLLHIRGAIRGAGDPAAIVVNYKDLQDFVDAVHDEILDPEEDD